MNRKRLSQKELKKIGELVKSDKSLNQITEILKKSKTTVYYHFRKIKGRTVKPISFCSKHEELIGEFIGLFAGDGCADKTADYQYRTYLFFNNINEREYVNNLIKKVLIKLFEKKPMIFRRENRLILCYYSKNIQKLIKEYLTWNKEFRKTYSVGLINKKYSKFFKMGFLRGSLDSDGYFNKKKISFATVSPNLMINITNFLNDLEIAHSVRLYKEKRENRKDIYHINIIRRDFVKFIELIKPRNIKD